MRNLFPALAAAAFALSIVTGGCAKESSPPPPRPAKTDNAAPVKRASKKPRLKLFTGTIENMDPVAGTLTVTGPKGTLELTARGKVKRQLNDLKIGDKVIVKHIDEIAHSIVKPRTGKNAPAWKDNGVL